MEFTAESRLVGDTPIQTLAIRNTELKLGHIEPTAMLGWCPYNG
jgi:hypothetical protein